MKSRSEPRNWVNRLYLWGIVAFPGLFALAHAVVHVVSHAFGTPCP